MQDLRGFPSHNPRLEDCERESSIFPHRASSTSADPREATTWGSDVELEEMESEQIGLAFSLPPSSERANSPVESLHDFQFPSPRARDTVSFGLDDILHTAASDSEDFGPALADALPPSGLWMCWIGPMSPASPELRNSTSGSSAVHIPSLKGGSCHFSAICIERSPDPGSSHFPPALITRRPLTSPPSWVLWSRVTPPCRCSKIFGLPSFTLFGSFLEVPPPPSCQAV